jgi:hypothetical protein
MHVRRFFCKKSTCARNIFVERLPELCHPHAQRTKRLQKALSELGLKEGGQAGADMGSELGISGSRDTILRLVRQSEQLALQEPHVIGLDDWAWKRRLRYGTLICDLERGWPIDLLPDRTVETVSAWLKKHPSIDTISRDGSSEYASAIKKGAPQARQVSDRWHLTKNLAGCVSVVLTQCLTEIRHAERAAVTIPEEEHHAHHHSHPRTQAEQHTQQARQSERSARYEHIVALSKQGMKSSDIAVHVGMPERTVRHWLSDRGIPYSRPRRERPHLIDPYKTYLLSRWCQGCHNGSQLERELRAKGYKGSERAIYRYLETLEPSDFSVRKRRSAFALGQSASPIQPNPLLTLSAQQVTWLFFRKQEDLKEEERTYLRLLRQEFDLLKLRVLYQSKKNRDRKNKKNNHQAQQVGHLKKLKSVKSGINSQHITTGISKVA